MLEAKDIDNVDKGDPFLGATVDPYCGMEESNVTRSFTLYVDTVRYFNRKWELID